VGVELIGRLGKGGESWRLKFETHEAATTAVAAMRHAIDAAKRTATLRPQARASEPTEWTAGWISASCFCDLEYNDRPYDVHDAGGGRGWCIAEQGVALMVMAHLQAVQQQEAQKAARRARVSGGSHRRLARIAMASKLMLSRATSLLEQAESATTHKVESAREVFKKQLGAASEARHGKVVELLSGRDDDVVAMDDVDERWRNRSVEGVGPQRHLSNTLSDIRAATFTGKGDEHVVTGLLEAMDFTMRTATEQAVDHMMYGNALTTQPVNAKRRSRQAGVVRVLTALGRADEQPPAHSNVMRGAQVHESTSAQCRIVCVG